MWYLSSTREYWACVTNLHYVEWMFMLHYLPFNLSMKTKLYQLFERAAWKETDSISLFISRISFLMFVGMESGCMMFIKERDIMSSICCLLHAHGHLYSECFPSRYSFILWEGLQVLWDKKREPCNEHPWFCYCWSQKYYFPSIRVL